jgi:hypothetical protein
MSVRVLGRGRIHHAQHSQAAAVAKVPPDEQPAERQEDDIEIGRGVQDHACLEDFCLALRRDQAQPIEDELDGEAGGDHRRVEAHEQEPRSAEASQSAAGR